MRQTGMKQAHAALYGGKKQQQPSNRWILVYPWAVIYLGAYYTSKQAVLANIGETVATIRKMPKREYHVVADGGI